ncbi:MAG: hypothetical protein AAB354_05700 [candidate division KSB1 bacterium]
MRTEDWIQGQVLNVLDGATFDLRVVLTSQNNDFPYDEQERVRIDQSSPSLETEAGEEARLKLEALLLSKTVRCFVKSRDQENVLLCDVDFIM